MRTRDFEFLRLNEVPRRGGRSVAVTFICFLSDIRIDFEVFPRNAFDGPGYLVANIVAFAGDLAIFVTGDGFLLIESAAHRCIDFVCTSAERNS